MPLFSSINFDALADVAQAIRHLEGRAGDVLINKGEEADALFHIDSGEFICRWDGGEKIISPGHSFGILQILAQLPYQWELEAKTAYTVARLQADELLSVLELHFDFAQSLNTNLLQRMVEIEERVAQKKAEGPA